MGPVSFFSPHSLCYLSNISKIILFDFCSRRFLTKTNRLPKWGERFFANLKKYVPLIEESIVDRKTKRVTTYTRNIGLSRFMIATEKVTYTPDPGNLLETIAIKEVWIESGLYGFRTAVKNFGIERFKQNCTKATEGFNHVLHTLKHQNQNLNMHLKETQQRRWNQMKNAKENFCEKIGGANTLEKN